VVEGAVLQLIDLDVPRSFPDHRILEAGGSGLPLLTEVLRAYAMHNPDVGYCQVRRRSDCAVGVWPDTRVGDRG
jgi:hypothetical protein